MRQTVAPEDRPEGARLGKLEYQRCLRDPRVFGLGRSMKQLFFREQRRGFPVGT